MKGINAPRIAPERDTGQVTVLEGPRGTRRDLASACESEGKETTQTAATPSCLRSSEKRGGGGRWI